MRHRRPGLFVLPLLVVLGAACAERSSDSAELPPAEPGAEATRPGDPEPSGVAAEPAAAQGRAYDDTNATPPPAGADPSAAPAAGETPTFPREKLEQLVAPIALYPDPLLTDVLMAATYPAEVAEAAAFVRENPNLTGKELDAAIADRGWDVSVNTVTHATQAIRLMGDDPQWVKDLGDAFLAQQDDVLNAVQVMRNKACDLGHLKTTDQQKVVFEERPAESLPRRSTPLPSAPPPSGAPGYVDTPVPGETYLAPGWWVIPPPTRIVRIVPVQPEVVFVPVYNPRLVFGPPPPVIFYPRLYPVVSVGFAGPVVSFGVGISFINLFWGDLDWHRHRIYGRRWDRGYWYDRDRPWYRDEYIARASIWQHDVRHRRGIVYRHPVVERFYRERSDRIRADRDRFDRDGGDRFRDGRDGDGRTRMDGDRRGPGDLRERGGGPGGDRGKGDVRGAGRGHDDERIDKGRDTNRQKYGGARPGGGPSRADDKRGGGQVKKPQAGSSPDRGRPQVERGGSKGGASDRGAQMHKGGGSSQRGAEMRKGGGSSQRGSQVHKGGGSSQRGSQLQKGGGSSQRGSQANKGGGDRGSRGGSAGKGGGKSGGKGEGKGGGKH